LPKYARPPLVEVVSGVQFDTLASFKAVHFGAFRQLVKAEYPDIEDHSELAEVRRTTAGQAPQLVAQFASGPMFPRVFYLSRDRDFLLQLQRTRFLGNWRKQKETDEYPRFSIAHERFRAGWRTFVEFLQKEGIGKPVTNTYELQYVNHILADLGDLEAPAAESTCVRYLPNSKAHLDHPQRRVFESKCPYHRKRGCCTSLRLMALEPTRGPFCCWT
jgi:uncharacterized protein (TIGR04255 family)